MSSGRKPSGRGMNGGRGRSSNNRRNNGGRGGTMSSTGNIPDEDVLIKFMSYIRNQNPEALRIHQVHGGDERAFLQAARNFLQNQDSALPSKIEKLSVKDDPVVDVATNNQPKRAPIQRSPPRSPIPGQHSNAPLTSPLHSPPQVHHSNDSIFSELKHSQPFSPAPTHSGMHSQSRMPPGPSLATTQQFSAIPLQPPGFLIQPMNTTATTQQSIPSSRTNPPVSSPQPPTSQIPFVTQPLPVGAPSNFPPPGLLQPSALKPTPPGLVSQQQPFGNWIATPPGIGVSQFEEDIVGEPPAEVIKTKPVYQPKRIWTRADEQPGRLFANNVAADGPTIDLRPRQELTAKWILPLKYLRERMVEKKMDAALTIRDALEDLAVGLFRRGCTENGSNASIISKEILAPSTENRSDYPFKVDSKSDTVFGTIPFYAPRTPGHVLFRLYWQNEPLYTLAVGPTLFVRVSEEDFEPTLRFILSNFKSRKGSATSLSSLNALATVLEQFRPERRSASWDGAGRAAWGCVCESRKVLELCASEHVKGKEKLRKLQEEIDEAELQVAQDEAGIINDDQNALPDDDGSEKSTRTKLREKTHLFMGSRASNDRKWKDAQVSFASILKAIVSNPCSSILFRRELLAKIRLEYELWCSLVESFAPSPFNSNDCICVNFDEFPQHVTAAHYKQCEENRMKMQNEMLGFVPNNKTLEATLFKKNQPQTMDRKIVDAFNSLSTAMGKLYEDTYMVVDRIHQQREMVRAHLEGIVSQCDAFPPGTRVLIFGSSANGFGSPTSDLDMCLQLPPNTKLPGEETDPTGAQAMADLAHALELNQMQNVDTVRLTARIPIIMFNCPRPMAVDGESELMECDLSFLNSLAVMNTSLLLTYSRIQPVTRVLAAIIKRWAKSRDINNPSKHTLSSYGYIIMLLHFLTYHRRKGNGLICSLDHEPGTRSPATNGPLLPNLQWMDPNWLKTPTGQTSYTELDRIPMQLMQHPLEDKMVVNTYYHRVITTQDLAEIQNRFPSQDLSLAILLASFFRYFAFEFDYKHHVVSLHSTMKRGMVEREIKAEIHGWKVYSTGLAVEDPFETFYDVAHVVKGSNFHRLRNEFALAYTKIIDAVESGNARSGMELINLICEPVEKAKEGQAS